MDAVITYVDNTDLIWAEEFKKWSGSERKESTNIARFRPWDNLKYCLRSIAKNASFIRKVHLIVSGPSQVPSWINTNEVNIVYHKDIIPEEYLPTFNSRTIEICMHNIKDLDEEFIYFNDDMYLIKPLSETDFFENGKVASTLSSYTEEGLKNAWGKADVYFSPHKRCTEKVYELLNISSDNYYLTNHGPSPFLKSLNKELFEKLKDDILPTLTRFRTDKDYVHFMYSIYTYLKHKMSNSSILTNTYISNRIGIHELQKKLTSIQSKTCCINDIFHQEERKSYENTYMEIVNDFLDMVFPNISKYENPIRVSLCTIVKNENRYLREYCEHYLNLGFHKIYLYDNNDIDGECPKDILQDYIDNQNVIYLDWRGKQKCQQQAYNNCLNEYKNECDWIAFFDADEFLELFYHTNITDFITQNHFNDFEGICVNWRCYGDNDEIFYRDQPIKERFIKPAIVQVPLTFTTAPNYYVKTIVKTKSKANFKSVHYPDNIILCDTSGKSIFPSNFQKPVYCNVCLNHYITKSLEEWVQKVARGYPDQIMSYEEKMLLIQRYFKINKWTEIKEKYLAQFIDQYISNNGVNSKESY